MRAATRQARSEGGYTLIELLVTISAGIVVMSALFAIFDVTTHQTARTFSKVSATQSARTITEAIENELHSSCVGGNVTPVQPGSDANDLYLVSEYGASSQVNAASPTPVEHKLVYSPTAGTITDSIYPAASGATGPNWTFSTTATSAAVLGNAGAFGTTPVFQYFAYSQPMNGSTPYTDAAGNTYMMIQDGLNYLPGSTTIKPAAQPLDPGSQLTTADAANTSEVLISFVSKPGGGSLLQSNLSNVGATIQDQVVLRLTPPPNHAGPSASFTPCN